MNTSQRIKKFISFVLEVTAAALVGSGLAAGLAIAIPAVAPAVVPAVAAQTVAPNVPLSQTISHNWSGYVAQDKTYTGVGGSWVVPTPTVADLSSQADATWVGIGGVSGNDLIQAGTQAIVQNGVIEYQAWVERLPGYSEQLPLTITGGDSVNVSLIETKPGTWHLTFIDNTTGKSYQTNLEYDSSNTSAEWIEEMPVGVGSGYIPLDQFGNVTFTNAWAVGDGVRLTPQSAGAVPLKMGLSSDALLATPGALADTGDSFSVARSDLALNTTPTITRRHHFTEPTIPAIPTDTSGDGGGITIIPGGDGSYTVTMIIPFGLFR